MKREIGLLSNNDGVDGSRTKRQKQVAATTGTPEHEDVKMETGDGSSSGATGLTEQGTKLWQMVKDVVNKECVTNPT